MPPPLLLIHGCNSDWRVWQRGGWVDDAEPAGDGGTSAGAGWSVWHAAGATGDRAPLFLLDYSGARSTIRELSWAVRDGIGAVKSATGAATVVVITHSMGGLLARAYVQSLAEPGQYRSDVAGLFTIACPHNGARLVGLGLPGNQFIASRLCPQAPDLAPMSGVTALLNERPLPADLKLATFTGLCYRSRWFGYHDGVLYADDTIISARVAGGFVPAYFEPRARHSAPERPDGRSCEAAIVLARPVVEAWVEQHFP